MRSRQFAAMILMSVVAFSATGIADSATRGTTVPTPRVSELPAHPGAPAVTAQGCDGTSENTSTVLLKWQTVDKGPQWLDLSLADNGFAEGTFVTVGPLESWWKDFYWSGLLPNRRHFVRVNTLTDSGWRPSPTQSFVTADCVSPARAQLVDSNPQMCEGASVTVVFRWFAANPSGQQWIDLSTQDNRFAAGTFIAAGPFTAASLDADGEGGANLQAYFWRGLKADTTHYWRVNTWTGSQWLTSATGKFKTQDVYHSAIDGTCAFVVATSSVDDAR